MSIIDLNLGGNKSENQKKHSCFYIRSNAYTSNLLCW